MNHTSSSFPKYPVLCLGLIAASLSPELQAVSLEQKDAGNGASMKADQFLQTVEKPKGWKGAVLAEDPDIVSPTTLSIDEKGRVYVGETSRFRHGVEDNRNHLEWAKEDMAVQTIEDRLAIYQKYAPKLGGMSFFTKFAERVRVLEPKDGKWVSRVLAEFNDPLDGTAGGVFAFKGDIWFSNIPSVWRLRDNGGSGASSPRESVHRGFGVGTSISGHDLNGFAMGLDGRLYFSVGDRGFNLTTPEGAHLVSRTSGAVLRMEMDGSHLEVVHRGLRNPKEVAFDRLGNLFSVDNDSGGFDQARIVQVVEGAESGWDRGHENLSIFGSTWEHPAQNRSLWFDEGWWRKKADRRPDAVLPPADIYTKGPSGLAYFPGTGFAPKWDNMFLICDWFARGDLKGFRMKPEGASFVMESKEVVMSGIWTPDIEFGYDGKLYAVDRKDSSYNNKTGRLVAFWDEEHVGKPEVAEVESLFRNGIENLPSARLGELLGHPDMRVRLRAEWELSTRAAEGREQLLAATAPETPLLKKLHATCGLGILARRQGDSTALSRVLELTGDAAPIVRARAAEIVGELALRAGKDKAFKAILPLLEDSDAQVRMLASIAIGKTGVEEARQPLLRSLERNADADAYLRHGAVMGLFALGAPEKLTAQITDPNVAIRRGVLLTLRRFGSKEVERFLNDPDRELVREAIQAIYDARISECYATLAKRTDLLGKMGPTLDNRLLGVQMLVGGGEEFQRLMDVASDAKKSLPMRSEALWLVRNWEKKLAMNPVTGSFDPKFEASQRAVSAQARQELATRLLALASSENGEFLPEVLETLQAYQVEIPEGVKRAIFAGVKNPISARLQALESLGPVPDVLAAALKDASLDVRMLGLNWLLKQDESAGLRQIDERLKQGTPREKQNLVALLGSLSSQAATERLNALIENWSGVPQEIRADLWTVAINKKECAERFQKLRATLKESGDSLAEFRAALAGGDAVKGRKVFYETPAAMCVTCHMAEPGGGGGTAGPSLEKVAARGEEYLLRSVVEPSADFAPGYVAVLATLKAGETVSGVLWKRDETGLEIKLADGKIRNIPKGEIESMTNPVSPMPPMGQILSIGQIRDVVAFLKTLTPENRDQLASRKIKPVDLVQRAAVYLDVEVQPPSQP